MPKEAAAIKAIPFSLFSREDLHFWPHTCDEVFSFKSAYHLLLGQAEIEVEGSLSEGGKSEGVEVYLEPTST